MSRYLLMLSFSLVISACIVPVGSAPTTSPTAPIPTLTPTPQPTERPTAVPTPTEIPDPTMPLGVAGKDAEGTYVKMENGDIARKVEYKTSAGEILYEGWAVEKTQEGGIVLIATSGGPSPSRAVPVKLMIASNVSGAEAFASLTSPDNPDAGHDSLNSVVNTDLQARKNIPRGDLDSINGYYDKLRKGELSLPFITSSGKSVEAFLGPDTGFITIVVPWDSLVPAEGNGVSEWINVRNGNRFRSTMLGVDTSGSAIGLIASQTPLNELPDSDVRLLTLFHAASTIAVENQQIQGYSVMLDLFVQYADKKGAKTIPDIIITRNP